METAKIGQVKQLNTRLALKALITILFKDLTQLDYDGRYEDQINNLAEAIATDQVNAAWIDPADWQIPK